MTNRKLTWKPDLPDFRDFKFKATRSQLKSLPKKAEITKLPPVRDQLNIGSCTGQGVNGIYETIAKAQGLNFLGSPLFAYYNARLIENNVKNDDGAEIRDAIKGSVLYGISPESYWPYRTSKFAVKPTKTAYTQGLLHQVVKYERVDNKDINQIKAVLAAGYPIVFGFTCYDSMFTRTVDKTGDIPLPEQGDKVEGGHCVWMYGYDDKVKRVKFRNSWGFVWGNKGNGTLPYDYVSDTDLCDDCWKVTLVE